MGEERCMYKGDADASAWISKKMTISVHHLVKKDATKGSPTIKGFKES
jgi:hypothetical protein